jgi:hypothetical protein
VRRLAAAVLLAAALAATPSAVGVVAGNPVDVRDVPWSVLVIHRVGSSGSICTGAILDSTRVLTAAHCVVDGGVPYPASTLTVRAGVTNAAQPSSTDSLQDRPVASIRVHPGYVQADRSGGDDVSVLTLATPLDLSGPTAVPIALPSPGMRWRIGDSVSLAGYGVKTIGGTVDGTLNAMTGNLVDQGECLPPAYDTANGVLLCAFSSSSSPCSGDSGGALVLGTPGPVVIGVTRASSCRGNASASFADVTAPEILQFIQGNDNPPTAPRPSSPSSLGMPTPVMQVGQNVTCRPGGWSGTPTFAYEFRESTSDAVLSSGPSPTYRLTDGDAGRILYCRVLASNDGGTTFDQSPTASSQVQAAPALAVPLAAVRRGGTAAVRVKLLDWVRPFGKVDVCVRLAPRIGWTACRTATPAGSAPTVVMRVKVKSTAPVVRARASVTVRAADGRAANAPAFLGVR